MSLQLANSNNISNGILCTKIFKHE